MTRSLREVRASTRPSNRLHLNQTRGEKTEEASGLAFTDRDGFNTMVVPEQDLIRIKGLSEATLGGVTVHELAHMARDIGMPADKRAQGDELYQKRLAQGGPWLTDHAARSTQEYFATGVEAYMGRLPAGPGWLERHDPELLKLLAEMFPRKGRP
jgi:hypothetical protein